MKNLFAFLVPALCILSATFVSGAEDAVPAAWYETEFPKGVMKAGKRSSSANKKQLEVLKGKFVGIYSSAAWCGYCHYFTPQLVDFRKKHADEFEVVFVSSDNSEAAMVDYCKKYKMKWLAVPLGSKTKTSLSDGLPGLVVLAPDGSVLHRMSGASAAMQAKKPDPRFDQLYKKMSDWKKQHGNAK
ncbi:MAG: redoxin family protein [Opitutales bacterium]|nr:redoxin family protein [Opitutales bacterium]